MFTRTTTQLLDALRDPRDSALWQAFDDRYRPIITEFAERRGLSHTDAADAAQVTLAEFAALYKEGAYDRTRGRLRSWLIGIALNRIASLRRSSPMRVAVVPVPLETLAREPRADDQAVWCEAVRRSVLDRALHSLRTESRFDDRTITAFELTALRGVPPAAAAADCCMSTAEVYVAKNRVISKLREITARLMEELDCA